MRGTLHFVPGVDLRWMLALLTPRPLAASAGRLRQLELTEEVFSRCRKKIGKALQGGRAMTRPALFEMLEADGIATGAQRGYHILWWLSQVGFLCFGLHEGKQPTFVLLDEWIPSSKKLDRGESLAELTRRYFISHGPATLQDFSTWSGLKITDARAGLEAVQPEMVAEKVGDKSYWRSNGETLEVPADSTAFLLPGFDEYLLGYQDRSDVLGAGHFGKVVPGGNGVFMPMIVLDGQIVGTWKRTIGKSGLEIVLHPFGTLRRTAVRTLEEAALRMAAFLGETLAGVAKVKADA